MPSDALDLSLRRLVSSMLLAHILAVPSLAAQEMAVAADLFIDRVDVQRVVVDLVVEKNGQPVTDLRREEIRLFDEGEEVEILGFSPPGRLDRTAGFRRVASAEESLPETMTSEELSGSEVASDRRTLVVFLDELHMKPFNRKRVLKSARTAAEGLIDAGGEVSVVAFDGQLRLLQEATSDKKVLAELFREEMKSLRTPMMAALADPVQGVQLVEQDMRDNTQDYGTDVQVSTRTTGNDPCVHVGGIASAAADQAAAVALQSLGGLRLLIGSVGRFEGRKAILHVSDGIPLIPGLEVYTYAIEMCDGTAKSQGIPHAIDTEAMMEGMRTRWNPHTARAEMMARDTTRSWREIAAYANAQQVTLYPIQSTGLQGLGSGGANMPRTTISFTQAAEANTRDGLFLAAEETGGEKFINSNDFGALMLEAAQDADSVYQLTFEPGPLGGNAVGKRNLRLEVSRPGVNVRYRRSYSPRTADSELVDYAVSGLLFGRGSNELGLRLAVSDPVVGDRGAAKVTVQINVPLDSLTLLPIGEDRRGRFTVAISAQQLNGRYLPIGHRTIDVLASEVDQTSQSFRYEVELPFRGKGVRLSAAVRDDVGGGRSLRVTEVSAAGSPVLALDS